jgi:drug/metabolite transporter (DMT)-like permease
MNTSAVQQQRFTSAILPTAAFWLLGLIWGSNFLYMKLAVQFISPMQVVFLRVVLSVLPIVIYAGATHAFSRWHLKYWYHFLVMSVLATVVYYFCFVQGSHLLYSGIAGAISGSTPLFTFVLGILFLNEEKITLQKVIGLLLGLLGILLLAKPFGATSEVGASAPMWQGILYMGIGSLSFGASFIYAKKFITPLRIPSSALTAYQLVGASLILFVSTPFPGMGQVFHNLHAALGLIIGLSFLGTGLAYLIYYFIIERLGAIKASSVAYIPPIVALVVGATLGHEPIVLLDYLGTLIVLVGVYLLKKP